MSLPVERVLRQDPATSRELDSGGGLKKNRQLKRKNPFFFFEDETLESSRFSNIQKSLFVDRVTLFFCDILKTPPLNFLF